MSIFRSSATARPCLRELNQILRATVNGDQRELRKPWWDQIREWQQAHPLAYQQEAGWTDQAATRHQAAL